MERPNCERSDCFANKGGGCVILRNNDFQNRACPFYKDRATKAAEDARCAERAAEKKRKKQSTDTADKTADAQKLDSG